MAEIKEDVKGDSEVDHVKNKKVTSDHKEHVKISRGLTDDLLNILQKTFAKALTIIIFSSRRKQRFG